MTEPLLMFTSTCNLKAQICQGLGPFSQIELLKTGNMGEQIMELETSEAPHSTQTEYILFILHKRTKQMQNFPLSRANENAPTKIHE